MLLPIAGAPCEVGIFGPNPCGKPATVVYAGQWFCADCWAVIEKQGGKK